MLSVYQRDPNVLYAGTDDGNLWVTTNGGAEWKKCKVPGVEGPLRVNAIEASKYDEKRAYVVFDGHYYETISVGVGMDIVAGRSKSGDHQGAISGLQ